MSQLAGWLSSNTATLSILGAAVAFIWSTTRQMAQRRAEADERQFQAFHKLIERHVSPERNEGLVYVDRQAAVIFELRHFPRYYRFTERMLARLRKKREKDQAPHWANDQPPPHYVLIKEIDLTLEHIQQSK